MSLPRSENFRVISPLPPETVMERISAVTRTAKMTAKGEKIYTGFLKDNSFEITRKTDREQYHSRIPLVPFLRFMPGFLKGVVKPGKDGQTIVDITIQSEKVINGTHRLTWALIKFSVFVIVAVAVIVPLILFLFQPNAAFDWETIDRVMIAESLSVLIVAWIGISLIFLAFDYFNVVRYKERYAEIAAFEKKALTELLKGKLQ